MIQENEVQIVPPYLLKTRQLPGAPPPGPPAGALRRALGPHPYEARAALRAQYTRCATRMDFSAHPFFWQILDPPLYTSPLARPSRLPPPPPDEVCQVRHGRHIDWASKDWRIESVQRRATRMVPAIKHTCVVFRTLATHISTVSSSQTDERRHDWYKSWHVLPGSRRENTWSLPEAREKVFQVRCEEIFLCKIELWPVE